MKNPILFAKSEEHKAAALWYSPVTQWIFIATVLVFVVAVAILYFFGGDAKELKLQYNVYFGVSARAPWWSPYIIACVLILQSALNYYIASVFYRRQERVAAHIILIGTFLVVLAFVVMCISLVLNNA